MSNEEERQIISKETLSMYFHLPLQEAAKRTNICPVQFKKICRQQGIQRWPHRKIRSITVLITEVEKNSSGDFQFKVDLETLKRKKQLLLENPNLPYRDIIPKYISNCLKSQIEALKLKKEPYRMYKLQSGISKDKLNTKFHVSNVSRKFKYNNNY